MTTATGARDVAFARSTVWAALADLPPYCPVCDVSYVCPRIADDGAAVRIGEGTRFVCVQGRLGGAPPPPNAVSGEIVQWVAQRFIETRLELASELWRTRVELVDSAPGSTQVTVTVTHQPTRNNRLLNAFRRKAMQRMVQRTVDLELEKLPDHVRRSAEDLSASAVVKPGSASVQEEDGDLVLRLLGTVGAEDVERLQLQQRLEELPIVAIDVRELDHLDSAALPLLVRWARRSSKGGRQAVIRGANPAFDELLAVMGLTPTFLRDR